MRKFLIATIAATAVASASPAAADEKVTVVVSFADLDIATPEGRETLQERIDAAVTTVCGRAPNRSLLHVETVHTCRSDALADAMAQVEAHLAALPVEIAVAD